MKKYWFITSEGKPITFFSAEGEAERFISLWELTAEIECREFEEQGGLLFLCGKTWSEELQVWRPDVVDGAGNPVPAFDITGGRSTWIEREDGCPLSVEREPHHIWEGDAKRLAFTVKIMGINYSYYFLQIGDGVIPDGVKKSDFQGFNY